MAHFDEVWPSGLIDGLSTIDETELEQLDSDHAKAINGDEGGTWSPNSPIIIGGGSGAGGLALSLAASGDTPFDWPSFDAEAGGFRTRKVACAVSTAYKATNFAPASAGYQQSSATGGSFDVELDQVHDGATLESITLFFRIMGTHSGLPAVFPALSCVRVDITGTGAGVALNSGDSGSGLAISAAGSVVAYEAGKATQSFKFVCNQNNVIDHTIHRLIATVIEESGANSVSGNIFLGLQLEYRATDMRFP